MKERKQLVGLGPSAPVVPFSHFSKIRLKESEWEALWSVCGPSVARNLGHTELWKVIAMAYLEGLNHGAGLVSGD